MKTNKDDIDVSWHTMTIKEIFDYLGTSNEGLTPENVIINLQKYGVNEIHHSKRKSKRRLFLDRINNFLMILLLILLLLKLVI